MQFSPAELVDVERSIKRLVLAAQDMLECRAAVDLLEARADIPGDLQRAVETGASVAYARPWTRATIRPLENHWLPTRGDQLALHEHLITARNKLYAHTDEEFGARWVAGYDGMLDTPQAPFIPAWRPLTLDRLSEIAELAESQKIRFGEGALELIARRSS